MRGKYTGWTERSLSTRIKEHKDSVLKGSEMSALMSHNLETQGHTFDWDHVEVVDTVVRKYHQEASVAIHIRFRDVKIN